MSTTTHRVRVTGAALMLLCATIAPAILLGVPSAGAFTMPSFYDVPSPLPAGGPGTVIKTEPVAVPGLAGSMYRVMYKSKSIQGEDIAVTGMIAIPDTPAPAGGYRVLDWAHGTTGIADQCTPSLDPASDAAMANGFLSQGWVLTATDYEGLGTPGRHPYIVGDSEARGVIDIVRAARNFNSEVSNTYLVWGHSQGGHAAMFAMHDAESWAPELNLVGVVAGAPPSQLDLVYDYLKNSRYKYYLMMVAAAINAAYGDATAPLTEVLNAQGIAMVDLVDQGCTGYLGDQAEGLEVEDLMVQQADGTYNPISNPVWAPLIRAQDPANFKEPAPTPLLIIHGGADAQIPTVSSLLLADQLCATGQDLERWMYPGQGHAAVIGPSFGDMLSWMTARFAGKPTPYEARPTGQDDVVDTICHNNKMITRAAYEALPTQGDNPATPETPEVDQAGDASSNPAAPVATPVTQQPTFTG